MCSLVGDGGLWRWQNESAEQFQFSYLTSSEGLVGLGPGSNGTGDVASMRAGFRMIGKGMGGTPTCIGEARGCRMRGDWLECGELWVDGAVNGTGTGGIEEWTGDGWSDPRTDNDEKSCVSRLQTPPATAHTVLPFCVLMLTWVQTLGLNIICNYPDENILFFIQVHLQRSSEALGTDSPTTCSRTMIHHHIVTLAHVMKACVWSQ